MLPRDGSMSKRFLDAEAPESSEIFSAAEDATFDLLDRLLTRRRRRCTRARLPRWCILLGFGIE
jgi:hypothetical protein